ncbi:MULTISPECIES: hypothetical protein [unclassified Nocardioides]|uniref:hypothetical protein n=1 Tax=unclassified Nocardioides TaxID=2615069 RepID=UPI0009EFE178|nr:MULTISPECIES: hypothetical protein [unclassified Nocardioides]GAW52164.1 uncharacterized protein (Precursor) [Nocardioides sp. PD653-B2]GAW55562.1 uncharacterized protein (Precursor) [Nocardioides sp. PD653]
MSKQLMLALGAGGAATAAVVASAASLGSVNSTDLGAGTSVIASCDSDNIDVSYTTAYQTGNYKVTSVTLSNVAAACIGQRVKITLADGTATPQEIDQATPTWTGLLDARTADFTVASPPLAEDVVGVSVVISG